MIDTIFGSNAIEHAGQSYQITTEMCRRVFRGGSVEETVSKESDEYAQALVYLQQTRRIRGGEDEAAVVLQSRREVIQHAKAMHHMVVALVDRGSLLTETLILDTHAILCKGIINDDGTSPEDYAGQYRVDDVAVHHRSARRPFRFIRPKAAPRFMQKMCQRYKKDVCEMNRTRSYNPFNLAARYSYIFANIHPFADGNGRMSRIILNAILFNYAGVCAPIGEEDDQSRQDYLDIMHRGSSNFLDETFEDYQGGGHEELAALVVCKALGTIKLLVSTLQDTSLSGHDEV